MRARPDTVAGLAQSRPTLMITHSASSPTVRRDRLRTDHRLGTGRDAQPCSCQGRTVEEQGCWPHCHGLPQPVNRHRAARTLLRPERLSFFHSPSIVRASRGRGRAHAHQPDRRRCRPRSCRPAGRRLPGSWSARVRTKGRINGLGPGHARCRHKDAPEPGLTAAGGRDHRNYCPGWTTKTVNVKDADPTEPVISQQPTVGKKIVVA